MSSNTISISLIKKNREEVFQEVSPGGGVSLFSSSSGDLVGIEGWSRMGSSDKKGKWVLEKVSFEEIGFSLSPYFESSIHEDEFWISVPCDDRNDSKEINGFPVREFTLKMSKEMLLNLKKEVDKLLK